MNIKIISRRVKELRLPKHLSQAGLVELVEISITYINQIETGKKQASLESLVRIAEVLGVTVSYLLNGNQADDIEDLAEMAQLTVILLTERKNNQTNSSRFRLH